LAVLSLAVLSLAGSSLKLEAQDGLAGGGEVRGYDAEKGIVRVMTGGAVTNLPLHFFNPKIQGQIIDWSVDKAFLSSSGLRISIKKQEEKTREKGSYTKSETNFVSYTINILNSSPHEIKGVKVTHRIFWEKQVFEKNKNRSGVYLIGTRQIDLKPGQDLTFETEVVPIRDNVVVGGVGKSYQTFSTGDGGSFTVQGNSVETYNVKDRLTGMHLRVSKAGWDGKVIERDFKNGVVPNQSAWKDYRLYETPNSSKTTKTSKKGASAVSDGSKTKK
jgi:hypothetical protein